MDATADLLVEFASRLEWDALPASTVHAAKRSIVDAIGCLYGGYDADCVRSARRLAGRQRVEGGATVIGTDVQTSLELAALANGTAIRYLDYSDDYFGGKGELGPHPSDNIGGVLAAVESRRQGGQSLILGTVIAYEAVGRLVDAVDMAGKKRTWDYPVLHAVGTALGSARVMELDAQQMRSALGLAVAPNMSLLVTRQGHLSNWKAFAGPNGSRNGLFASLLASEGITGPDEPFEGAGGLYEHLGRSWEIGPFDQPMRIEKTFFKALPIRYTTQLPVTIAFDLRNRLSVNDITRIDIFIARRFVVNREQHGAHWDPTTRETADHSLPYLVAAAFIDGEITAETFTSARYRDPTALRLTDAIYLAEDAEATELFPASFKVRFKVTLSSGEVVEVEARDPKGHPNNPMSDADLAAKFVDQTESKLGRNTTEDLLNRLWHLESIPDLRELLELMVIPAT